MKLLFNKRSDYISFIDKFYNCYRQFYGAHCDLYFTYYLYFTIITLLRHFTLPNIPLFQLFSPFQLLFTIKN